MNPVSGTKDKQQVKDLITTHLLARNIPFEFFPTNATGDYTFLEDKIKTENTRKIIVVGGDGTISQVASALRHLDIDFGIIPCGSGNGLALAAGISKDPVIALETAITGQPSRIDAFTSTVIFPVCSAVSGLTQRWPMIFRG